MTNIELKKWRQNNGYSQSDLAKVLGVIIMTISRWERGTTEIPPYLHLALKSLRKKKGEIRGAGRPPMKMKSKKEAKKHGLNLQERKKLMD